MKKIVAAISVLALALALVGCGSDSKSEEEPSTNNWEDPVYLEKLEEKASKDQYEFAGVDFTIDTAKAKNAYNDIKKDDKKSGTRVTTSVYMDNWEGLSTVQHIMNGLAMAKYQFATTDHQVSAYLVFDNAITGNVVMLEVNRDVIDEIEDACASAGSDNWHTVVNEYNKASKNGFLFTFPDRTSEKPNSTEAPSQPTPTTSQSNALKKAQSYLNSSSFSYTGLIEQLEYEKFSHEDAVYGADNCGADWNAQAVKKAQSYLKSSSFSRQGLIDQLLYEGFTQEQAIHGVDSVGL